MKKLRVIKEGRKGIYIPEKESLKDFIKARKLKRIHNFIPTSMLMLGADHHVGSVLSDIDKAERMAVFTNPKENMGHSLALILDNRLEIYNIGKIKESDLKIA